MEDFESLSDEEQTELEKRFTRLERRVDQLELEGGEGFVALKNQKRLMHYLAELKRVLEEEFDLDLPGVPSLEEPSED